MREVTGSSPVVPTTRNLKRTTFSASRFRFFLFCRLLATIPFKAQPSRSFIQAPAMVPKCVFAYVRWLKKIAYLWYNIKNHKRGIALKNLFEYATKELSQDAFLCWLFANFDCEQEEVKDFSCYVLSWLISDKLSLENIRQIKNVKILKQYKK